MIRKGDLEFGDIVLVSCDPSIGHEFKGKRPVVVIQSDEQLKRSNLVTIVPLTSNTGNTISDDIVVVTDSDNNLRTDSVAKVYHITSFDYSRFDKKIGKINANVSDAIKSYLKKHFDL
ncbi:MAG: type II toxin-antitoxin system PemK/MazF family toxin [Candidatus Giovannonibacteria bacterium]|nr:type II toxin-antitoxin system PemK/MazF family toxin [Candidatus Giovannonibacteria bacterium]